MAYARLEEAPVFIHPMCPKLVKPFERLGSVSLWQFVEGTYWRSAMPNLVIGQRAQAPYGAFCIFVHQALKMVEMVLLHHVPGAWCGAGSSTGGIRDDLPHGGEPCGLGPALRGHHIGYPRPGSFAGRFHASG